MCTSTGSVFVCSLGHRQPWGRVASQLDELTNVFMLLVGCCCHGLASTEAGDGNMLRMHVMFLLDQRNACCHKTVTSQGQGCVCIAVVCFAMQAKHVLAKHAPSFGVYHSCVYMYLTLDIKLDEVAVTRCAFASTLSSLLTSICLTGKVLLVVGCKPNRRCCPS